MAKPTGVGPMIERKEMQDVASRYRNPIGLVVGSHSALDAMAGLRNYGIRGIVYTTKARAEIYFREPRAGRPGVKIRDLPSQVRKDVIVCESIDDLLKRRRKPWTEAILLLDRYEDVLRSDVQAGLDELECIQIPNRAFAVYVGGWACEKIEKDFKIPIFGSRNLLKIENREEVERNYYWYLEKADILHPKEIKYEVTEDGIRFVERIEQPLVLKIPHAGRRLERGFIFTANGASLEEEVKKQFAQGKIIREDLETGRVEEYVPGVTANFNFFYSPLLAEQRWGDLEKYCEPWRLANEFLSIDERRETTHDGILRMQAAEQLKADWSKTKYPPTFEVTAHSMISLRESLLRKIYPIADKFVEMTKKLDPPGMIGAYCIQTLITFEEMPYAEAIKMGVYDASGESFYDFSIKTQDMAVRHGGGTNVHMGIGSQYANSKYQRPVSMGDRIAMELFAAEKRRRLAAIVT